MYLNLFIFTSIAVYFYKKKRIYDNVLHPLARWFHAYCLSTNNLKELAADRGIYCFSNYEIIWGTRFYLPILAKNYPKWIAPPEKGNWEIKEIRVKIKRKRMVLYILIDSKGKIIDFLAVENNNPADAKSFFQQSVNPEGIPWKICNHLSRFSRKKTNHL